MENDFGAIEGVLSAYDSMEDDAIREASEAASKEFSAFERELDMNKDVYDTMVGWKAKAVESGEWAQLTKEERIYTNKILIMLKRNGIELDKDTQERLKAIDEELEELEDLWSKNAIEADEEMKMKVNATLAELEGVPQDILDELKNATGDGKMKSINVGYSYDVLVFAKNEELRHKLE
jgi:Zn-dependent oligopeptidase